MKLQPVALALAISDDEEYDMAFFVDVGAGNLLIVDLSLEPVWRRPDRLRPRKRRPYAEGTRDMLVDIEDIVRAGHQTMGRHHIGEQRRGQESDAAQNDIDRTRHA